MKATRRVSGAAVVGDFLIESAGPGAVRRLLIAQGMRSLIGLAVIPFFLVPAAIGADELRAVVDPSDPCASEGLPAVSADGRLVAVIRCWSDLSAASEVTFSVVRKRDGRVVRSILLSSASTGGEDPTPEGLVRRAVRRANLVLERGAFRSLVPMVDDHGSDARLERAAGAGLMLGYDASSGQLVITDASSGRLRATETLEPYGAHPYCCGYDEADWSNSTCGLTPVVHGAWADAVAGVVVIRAVAYDGPDGCEQGPDIIVIPLV